MCDCAHNPFTQMHARPLTCPVRCICTRQSGSQPKKRPVRGQARPMLRVALRIGRVFPYTGLAIGRMSYHRDRTSSEQTSVKFVWGWYNSMRQSISWILGVIEPPWTPFSRRHMGAIASDVICSSTVCSTDCWCKQQRKHQSYTSLTICDGSRWLVESPRQRPVMRKTSLCRDVLCAHYDVTVMVLKRVGSNLALRSTITKRILPIYYSDVVMSAMSSQIAAVSIVYSTVCSGTDQR